MHRINDQHCGLSLYFYVILICEEIYVELDSYKWVSDCLLFSKFSAWWELVNFQWNDDEVCFVLDQPAVLGFYSASSLKQQSADRHVARLWHIILIQSQPVFFLSPECRMVRGEATNMNFIDFGLTDWLAPTIYCTRCEHTNLYTTDAVWHILNNVFWANYTLLSLLNAKCT